MTSSVRTKTFIWDDIHEGWKPESSPQFDAGGGFLATHDVMEHFTDDSDFEHELMAFGSIVYGRMYHSHEITRVAAADLSNFLVQQKFNVKECNPRWDHKLPADDEASLSEFMLLVEKKFKALKMLTPVLDDFSDEKIKKALKNSMIWIRLGWRIANRRFTGHEREEVQDTFMNLMIAINDNHEKDPPKKGDRLVVHFHPDTLKFDLIRDHIQFAKKRLQLAA